MRLPALAHVIDATRSLTGCDTVTVLGSAALLLPFPALGDPDGPLSMTRDEDLLIAPCDELTARMVHEALGEGSLFEARNGYYVDLLRPEITEVLPTGWQQRQQQMANRRALVVDPVDICCAKLLAGRPKDLAILQVLLATAAVDRAALRERMALCTVAERELHAALRRLTALRFGISA